MNLSAGFSSISTRWLPSHPPLRVPRQRPACRQNRPLPEAAGSTLTSTPNHSRCRGRQFAGRGAIRHLPMLRRYDDHARDNLGATPVAASSLERHLMNSHRPSEQRQQIGCHLYIAFTKGCCNRIEMSQLAPIRNVLVKLNRHLRFGLLRRFDTGSLISCHAYGRWKCSHLSHCWF